MAWDTDIIEAVYISPSGKSYPFGYESNLTKKTDLKTASFTFPGKDGSLVVPLGIGGKSFSFNCLFYGKDCKKEADDFEEALCERGYGELQHPLYGNFKVVPTGSIERSDDVVSGVGVSTVAVTFATSYGDVTTNVQSGGAGVSAAEPDYKINPGRTRENNQVSSINRGVSGSSGIAGSVGNAGNRANAAGLLTINGNNSILSSAVARTDVINAAFDVFQENAVADFVRDLDLSNIPDAIEAGNVFKEAFETVVDGFTDMAKISSKVYSKVIAIKDDVLNKVTKLVDTGKDVAMQTVRLIRLPGEIACDAGTKIAAYTQIAASIMDNFRNDPFNFVAAANQWAMTRLLLESLACACAAGVTVADVEPDNSAETGNFDSRDKAVSCAMSLTSLFDAVSDFEDNKVKKNLNIELGNGYAAMRDLVSYGVDYIINDSFALPTRKTIILGRDRQIVELMYELYGGLSRLDQFIIDNKINYNELEVIPMGREVVYYV